MNLKIWQNNIEDSSEMGKILKRFYIMYNVWTNDIHSEYVGFCSTEHNITIDESVAINTMKYNDSIIGFYAESDISVSEKIGNMLPLVKWYTENIYDSYDKELLATSFDKPRRCLITDFTCILPWDIFSDMMTYVFGFIQYINKINNLDFSYEKYTSFESTNWFENTELETVIEYLVAFYLSTFNISLSNRITNFDNSTVSELYKGKLKKHYDQNGVINIKNVRSKVALCMIVSEENLYLRDFVEYYQMIGVDKIYLYDNNLKNGENPRTVINDYIYSGLVEYINVRKDEVNYETFTNFQCQCYDECFRLHKDEFDWMCFFDADEFIDNEPGTFNIKEYLSFDNFNEFSVIQLNWKLYNANGKDFYENQPVYKRFTEVYDTCSICKIIVRCNIENEINFETAHNIIGLHESCNSVGEPSLNICFDETSCCNSDFEVFIKHYNTKSTSEYAYNKMSKYKYRDLYSSEDFFFYNKPNEISEHIIKENSLLKLEQS